MTLVQWLALVVGVIVVGGIYWLLRNWGNTDPWRNMDEPPSADADAEQNSDVEDRGEGLGGDSYIVAVRTLTEDRSAPTAAADEPGKSGVSTSAANASWQAYKRSYSTDSRGQTHPLPEADADNDESGAAAPAPWSSAGPDTAGEAPDGAGTTIERGSDPAPPRAESAPEADAREPAPGDSTTPREHIEPQPKVSDEQEIFIIHVVAGGDRRFAGADVHAALADQGLRFGFNDIYHRVVREGERLFSAYGVANMLNPGTLDPADQNDLETPGLTLFMVAPGSQPGPPHMRDMMETANALAIALRGTILDDRRAKLKAQTAQHMLDRIAELDRKAAVARRR